MSDHTTRHLLAVILIPFLLLTPELLQSGHPMPYRILWTWDAMICNARDAESFVKEYKTLIDFLAERDYNGLIIWGFLNGQRHSPVEAAREIARYGRRKGVRIIPGVGAGGYGGYFINSDHRFNLPGFLEENPTLRAVIRKTHTPDDYFLCLYQDESLEWLRNGAEWLANNFELGGVNIETNESFGMDVCDYAGEATVQEPNRLTYPTSFTDLTRAVPVIYEEIRQHHPDAWIIYATFWPPWWKREEDAWLLEKLPEDAIAQWNIELKVNEKSAPPPVEKNVALIHNLDWSYHLGAYSPTWGATGSRGFSPELHRAREFASNQRMNGVNGFVIGNGGSPSLPDNEINYIAYMEFSRSPDLTLDEFSGKFIGELYGQEAEPMVKKLMLDPFGDEIKECWEGWARLMYYNPGDSTVNLNLFGRPQKLNIRLQTASDTVVDQIEGRIHLAEKARTVANKSGQSRLEKMINIFREYQIIAELSQDPNLEPLRTNLGELSSTEYKRQMDYLWKMAKEMGLPVHIYKLSSFFE